MKTVPSKIGFVIFFIILFSSCQEKGDYLFKVVQNSNITFSNDLNYTQELNPYTYRNYYNGAGVAVADFDNDGLEDIYFTGNQVDNELYRNLGELKFEKITFSPLISCSGSWSTGVSIVDINSDGLKDIYVCKAGPPEGPRRYNELFINQGNFKFEEKAEEYGLKIKGFSIQASFFDFDRDGDLDCYLLNNSLRSVGGYDLRPGLRDQHSEHGNMLLVNENGVYHNRSKKLGIYSSDIGFGLGVNTSDFNNDGWQDLYVANDFFEKDYYYLNRKGKYFEEVGEDYFACFSMGSMGVDAGDIDHDGDLDILVAEMAPATLERRKTKATYESWDKNQKAVKSGYYHQVPRNTLQINEGNSFSEVSRMKGMDATEWSWAPLIFDMDNDGLKDVFISNGVGKDLLDRDYLAYMADEQRLRALMKNKNEESLKKLIDIMSSQKVKNAFFVQGKAFTFSNQTNGITDLNETFSNATALSDLDNDGDLDMIISNIDDKASILENRSEQKGIVIKLNGDLKNIDAIGAKVKVKTSSNVFYQINNPYRGFQSTLSSKLVVGIGEVDHVEYVDVLWPDGLEERFPNIKLNEINEIVNGEGIEIKSEKPVSHSIFKFVTIDTLSSYKPRRIFNEFNKEKMLIRMSSSTIPLAIIKSKKGGSSIFYGGAQNESIVISNENLEIFDSLSFSATFRSHVNDIHPFDADSDGDLDLYLSHGSRVFSKYSTELNDVLYENKGNGKFEHKKEAIKFDFPILSKEVSTYDFNDDGLQDIILIEGVKDDTYGISTRMLYFENQGKNQFVKKAISDESKDLGMLTSISIADIDGEGTIEIIATGEWTGIKVYHLSDDRFIDISETFGLEKTNGLWQKLKIEDIDGDGDLDIIAANQGTNSVFTEKSRMYTADFDKNGRAEQIFTTLRNGKYYPIHDMDEIVSQLPNLRSRVSTYSEYSKASIADLFRTTTLGEAVIRDLDVLESGVFINDTGQFVFKPFPKTVQSSSMHAIEVDDINKDGFKDILIGGNHYRFKPQFGRDDASRGHVVFGKIKDDSYNFAEVKTLNIEGELRVIEKIEENEYLIGVKGKNLVKYKVEYE